MKVDGGVCDSPDSVAERAVRVEQLGYAGLWVADTRHDPFVTSALAIGPTSSLNVGTSIAIAFARSPMTLAQTAHDLQALSHGRFLLGIGSQIKAHIQRRFSMPWSSPAARMREYVLAMRAIWSSWNEGTPLDFRGDFYQHTLMTPFFNPGPNGFGAPPVLLAGVGELMTQVAGEVGDGFICHGFTTEKYLRDVTLPALQRGKSAAGRDEVDLEVCLSPFIVTGSDEREFDASAAAARSQLSFYASTPAYRPVLELHGWQDLRSELTALSKAGRWDEMPGLIDDEMLATFAVVGEYGQIGAQLLQRYGDCVSRLSLPVAQDREPQRWQPVLEGIRRLA